MRIDLSNLNLGNLNKLAEDYMRKNATVTPTPPPVVPQPTPVAAAPAPVEYSSFDNPFLEYRDTLSGGANYANINDVDNVDDYYDTAFQKAFSDTGYLLDSDIIGGEGGIGGGQVDYSPTRILSEGEYRSFVGDAPAYLSDFKKDATLKQALTAVGSIKDLTSTGDIQAALSSYYGYDVQAQSQQLDSFGGNLATHTSSSKADLQQFHSLVEPILKEQVSYLQATEGLSYQDALSVSYNRDPMIQALYAKYDVKPYRQTKDGSTYLYDPFSFSEIRTSEIKDPSFTDIAVNLAKTALVASVLGPIAGSMFKGFKGAATAAKLATAGSTALATGGDPLQAMLLAGIPIGDIPIPFTGGRSNDIVTSSNTSSATLNSLTGNLVNWTAGSNPLLTAISTAGVSGGLQPTSSSSTGATPDFNPYINNIAAVAGGTTVEAEEENLNIDLANLAALYQQEEAPVTPISQAPFDDIARDTTVEAGELPELPLDVAPPPPPPSSSSSQESTDSSRDGEEEAGLDIISAQLREAIAKEEDPDVKASLNLELEKWLSSGPTEYERIATGPKPSDYEGENEEEQALLWIGALTNSYGTGTVNDATGGSGAGSGTGDGNGNGAGGGAGGGLGAGMLGGAAQAGGKPLVTDLVFSDYVKRYEAPALQQRALPLQGYQAPQGLFRGLV